MKNLVDVRNLLKQFGIVIYTGSPEGDVEMMMDELKELQQMGLIEREVYLQAYGVLAQKRANRIHYL